MSLQNHHEMADRKEKMGVQSDAGKGEDCLPGECTYTPEEDRRVLKKIDMVILPMVCLAVSAMDVANTHSCVLFSFSNVRHNDGSRCRC